LRDWEALLMVYIDKSNFFNVQRWLIYISEHIFAIKNTKKTFKPVVILVLLLAIGLLKTSASGEPKKHVLYVPQILSSGYPLKIAIKK